MTDRAQVFVLFESIDGQEKRPLAAYTTLEAAQVVAGIPPWDWQCLASRTETEWWSSDVDITNGVDYDYEIHQLNVDPEDPRNESL